MRRCYHDATTPIPLPFFTVCGGNVSNGCAEKEGCGVTNVCLISLLAGTVIVSMIFKRGGAEALGAIIPMSIVRLIHLVGAPAALLNAVKSGQRKAVLYVSAYLLAFVAISFLFAPPEIMVFHVYLAAVIGLTFLVYFTKVFLKKMRSGNGS